MEGPLSERIRFRDAPLAGVLFRESGDALLVVDPLTERVVDVNPMAQQLSELSREELLQASIRALLRHEQEWQDWLVPVHRPAPFHGREGFLLRTRQPGRWVPVAVTISPLHFEGGDPLALFALRDRREQVEAQRRVQRTEAELRRVLMSVSDCLWTCRVEPDGRWRYRSLSPVVQRLTGRSVGVYLEDPNAWEAGIDPEDLPRWRAFRAKLAAGQSGELEHRIRRPDGTRVWVRESVLVAPDEDGLLLHGVVTDVSERKRGEQQREAQAQKLESLVGMAGVLAHDFNNLITGILGHVSLARLETPKGGGERHELAQIEAIVVRAAELCRQLGLFAGKGGAVAGSVDLNPLVRDAVEQEARRLPEGVRLRPAVAESLPLALGDAALLREMIVHLLRNAIEALAAGGGEVAVRARPAGPDALPPGQPSCFDYRPAQAPPAALVCLEVQDGGPGLTPDVQARMFDPFFTTKPGARGLGLSIVLGIVRACQGCLQVVSAPGQGTTIRVLLPAEQRVERPGEQRQGDPRARVTDRWRGQTILLADDEETVLDVASRLLSSLGCAVLRARDGEQALRQHDEHAAAVRLALVDLTMPRLGGEATLRELRRRAPDLPLVLMSGYPESDIAPRFADLKLAGFLHKPFRLPALIDLLQRVLPV
jgi:PAS domain S-box-containing protein